MCLFLVVIMTGFSNDYLLTNINAYSNIMNHFNSYDIVSLSLISKLFIIHLPFGAEVIIAVDIKKILGICSPGRPVERNIPCLMSYRWLTQTTLRWKS